MILTCPSCATRYFADDASIGPRGRTVRCAACSHTWFVDGHLVLDQAAPDDLLPEPAASPQPRLTREQVERARRAHTPTAPARPAAQIRAEQAERDRRLRTRAAVGAWAGAGVVLAISAGGAVAMRGDVARAWPESAAAFAAIGMPVNVHGLEFADLEVARAYEGPTPVLTVSGAVRNISSDPRTPPAVRFSLRNAEGDEIYSWSEPAGDGPIEPGGARQFQSTIENPPVHAADLVAVFDVAASPAPHAEEEAGADAHGAEGEAAPEHHPAPAEPAPAQEDGHSDVPLASETKSPHAAKDVPLAEAASPAIRAAALDPKDMVGTGGGYARPAALEGWATMRRAGPVGAAPQADDVLELRGAHPAG